jgi:hypothetical protein
MKQGLTVKKTTKHRTEQGIGPERKQHPMVADHSTKIFRKFVSNWDKSPGLAQFSRKLTLPRLFTV